MKTHEGIARSTLIAVTGIVFVLFGLTAQAAATTTTQTQIEAHLQATSGGVQISPNQIAWQGGAAIMTFADGPAVAAACPSGWTCFYEHRDFGGRRLQFRSCGSWQHFGDYGFRNQASSWDNKLGKRVEVNDDDVSPSVRLWNEAPRSRSSFVGKWADDRADAFQILC